VVQVSRSRLAFMSGLMLVVGCASRAAPTRFPCTAAASPWAEPAVPVALLGAYQDGLTSASHLPEVDRSEPAAQPRLEQPQDPQQEPHDQHGHHEHHH